MSDPQEGVEMSPYFDQEAPERPVVGLIADFDDSPSWELSARALYLCADGGYLFVDVSGCSCWPGRGSTTQAYCADKAEASRAMSGEPELMDAVQAAGWMPKP